MTRGTRDTPKPGEEAGAPPRRTRERNLGRLRHRALMLAMQGRHAQAAQVILDDLGGGSTEVPELDPEARRLASIAATYLEKAGAHDRAAALFRALGEEERAAMSLSSRSLLQRGGAAGERTPSSPPTEGDEEPSTLRCHVEPLGALPAASTAAWRRGAGPAAPALTPRRSRVLDEARSLMTGGEFGAAASHLAAHGLNYEAGACLIKAGDLPGALDCLTRVPINDPQYLLAARTVVRVLCRCGTCDARQLHFLRDWIAAGPVDDDQADLFLRLADLAESTGGGKAAETVLRAVLRRLPDHGAAAARLRRLLAPAESRTLSSPSAVLAAEARDAPPPAPREEELRVGMTVANRFRIDAQIGQGGMATVFSARDLELDEQVALKVFAGQLITASMQQEAVERFRLELKVCRKLRHPNIIQVYDIGVFSGHRYYTMELLHGQGLDRLLGEPVEVPWGLECLIQAASGLHAAHEAGVVHRDVKPENLFVTDSGLVKVMDFGIAKSTYLPGRTQVGTLAGTPEYMAPEQINDFSLVGPAADQYALGCVAYQMFTGTVPFSSEQMMEVLMMHLERTPTSPRALHPELPEELEAVILRMMAKHPQARYGSLWEVVEVLDRLRGPRAGG